MLFDFVVFVIGIFLGAAGLFLAQLISTSVATDIQTADTDIKTDVSTVVADVTTVVADVTGQTGPTGPTGASA